MTQPRPQRQRAYPRPTPPPYPTLDPPPDAIPQQRHSSPDPSTPGPRNAAGGAALALSVIGVVLGLVPPTGFFALLCGGAAIVLARWGMTREPRRPVSNRRMSIVGGVLGGLAVLLGCWGVVTSVQVATVVPDEAVVLGTPGPEIPAPVAPTPPVLLPGQIAGEGTFVVGGELKPGTYRSEGASSTDVPSCYWAREKDAAGTPTSVIASGNSRGPVVVAVKRGDWAFTSRGCQSWTPVR